MRSAPVLLVMAEGQLSAVGSVWLLEWLVKLEPWRRIPAAKTAWLPPCLEASWAWEIGEKPSRCLRDGELGPVDPLLLSRTDSPVGMCFADNVMLSADGY